MPRYYFHLTDGEQVLNNHKGIDVSGDAAAREDALALARDLKHGDASIGRRAVEVEVPDHILAVAPVELLIRFK
jgi:hypothetical protein